MSATTNDRTPAFHELTAALQLDGNGAHTRQKKQQKPRVHGTPSAFDLEAAELVRSQLPHG